MTFEQTPALPDLAPSMDRVLTVINPSGRKPLQFDVLAALWVTAASSEDLEEDHLADTGLSTLTDDIKHRVGRRM